jgi:hypothetical protein
MKRSWVVAALVGTLLVPFKVTTVPEWRVTAIDTSGVPLKGVKVRQTWQHYSLETRPHEEERETGESGAVLFPERSLWAVGFTYLIGIGRSIMTTGIHASLGPSAWITGKSEPCMDGGLVYVKGEPLPTSLVVKPYPSSRCQP